MRRRISSDSRFLESLMMDILDELYHLEDPRGCPLQELRLKFSNILGYDSMDNPKKDWKRKELIETIQRKGCPVR